MAADSQPETTQDEDEWLNQVNKEKSRRGLPSHRAVVLEESFKAGESPKFVEVDLQHPTNSQRRLILDAALQTKDMDNARLLWKIRQRLDRQAMHAGQCYIFICMHRPIGSNGSAPTCDQQRQKYGF